ncbi:MAG: hypothetical protein KDE19_17745, partial [Caldilineaceae bacterium]|nr:hypothetical protein [Caldilineaceae bacterium]
QRGEFSPSLTLVTPDGELLHNLTTAAPPALIWYPPARWQPGERVRLTTLPLSLPALWGVVTANEVADAGVALSRGLIIAHDQPQRLTDVFHRTVDGVAELPLPAGSPPFATLAPLNPMSVQFIPAMEPDTFNATAESLPLTLHAWGRPTEPWPGGSLLIWLRWSGQTWPAGKTVFVHLRVTDETGTRNVVQRDGPPRFFVYYDAAAALAARGVIDDTRQLAIPTDLPVGTTLSLVVGLYDGEDGRRAAVLDMSGNGLGDEWKIAEFTVGMPPVPDQACAMIPATCPAQ